MLIIVLTSSAQSSTAVCHGQAFTTRPLALDQIWTVLVEIEFIGTKHWHGLRVILERASKLFKWLGFGRSSKFSSIATNTMRHCCIANLRPYHLNVSPIGRHDLWEERQAVL